MITFFTFNSKYVKEEKIDTKINTSKSEDVTLLTIKVFEHSNYFNGDMILKSPITYSTETLLYIEHIQTVHSLFFIFHYT